MKTMNNGFRIESAKDVASLTQPHPDIMYQGESVRSLYTDGSGVYVSPSPEVLRECTLLDIPIVKRGLLLTPNELDQLNYWASCNVLSGVFVMNEATAKALLGLEVCDPKTVAPFIKLGDVYYAAIHNSHNRLISEARLGSETKPGYVNDMVAGLWGYGDPLIIAGDGKIASAQHRAAAYLKALAIKPELGDIPFPCMYGLPPQMIDFIDRGRERKASDMEYRDETVFEQSLIDEVFTETPEPTTTKKLRQVWSDCIVTVRNNVHCRCRGIDVHPSGTQAPTKRDALMVDQRFTESTDLQRLILKCFIASKHPDTGKDNSWRDVWTVSHLATALVLRCNASHDNPETLTIDWEYIDSVCNALAGSSGENGTGPFGPAIADVLSAIKDIKKAGGSKPGDKELFGCLVTAMGQFDEVGETGKVWIGKRDRSKKERTKDKSFRIFGGVDIGFQAKTE